jgi:dipeptidyl aminopeptidase/acylaminoacyl peptidase
MFLSRGWIGWLLMAGTFVYPYGKLAAETDNLAARKSLVTVADMISMVRIAGPFPDSQYSPAKDFAKFSPDGQHFVFAVSSGNPQKNTTDCTLLLFRTAELPHAKPRKLLTFSSSSNRAAISAIRWAPGGGTIYFLGSRAADSTQLYSIQLSSGEIRQWTHHSTSLESYALSEKGVIAYAAEPATTALVTPSVLRHGFHVTTENLVDLVRGEISRLDSDLFVLKRGSSRERRLQTAGCLDSGINDLYLSPNGQFLVVKTSARNVPPAWADYDDVNIKAAFRVQAGIHSDVRILRYELLDIRTGQSEMLLNGPATYRSGDVLWAPDSKSLILCGTYLPLNLDDPSTIEMRKSNRFVLEITLKPRKVVEIAKGDPLPLDWDANTNIVHFDLRQDQTQRADSALEVSYQKTASGWTRANTGSLPRKPNPEIAVKQDLNLPPEAALVEPKTNRRIPFLNLNPRFENLAFGKVEAVHWEDASGNSLKGGLYFPPDYKPGTRYPLVIQTHGFDPASFSVSGYYNTAFAAQPLASRGIIVLQMDDIFYDSLETTREAERAMNAYESAVSDLDRRRMIDPDRVGIIGFSRTSFYVKYALTHSVMHFAAAIVCDGFDAGYFQYLLFANSIPFRDSEIDAVIGTPAFGAGMPTWLSRSPGFLLDRVHTPILIQAIGPTSLMGEWEWFSGLMRLEKPVDLLYLPTGTHVLVKPWDRMTSEGGTVDWFCFWLKGQADPAPNKAQQYERWNNFRRQSVRSGSPN